MNTWKGKMLVPAVLGCFFLLATLACVTTREQANDVMKTNQERAEDVIRAIDSYEQDHGRFPEQLDVLAPIYLSSVPTTTVGGTFSYELDDLEGYYLCFYVTPGEDWGCCYDRRLEGWDCFHNYGE